MIHKGGWVMNWAVPTKRKVKQWTPFALKSEDFSQFLMDLRLQDPTLKIKVHAFKLCVYIYLSMYIGTHIYTYIYIYTYVYIHLYLSTQK